MKARGLLAVLAVSGLVAAGCSSSKNTSSGATTSTPAASSAPPSSSSSGSTGGSGGPATGSPVLVAFFNAETGPNANPQFDDAMKLAAQEINANGGLGGHVVQVKAFNTPDYAPNTAINAVNQALSEHPVAMIGIAITDQTLAVSHQIQAAQVPLIQYSTNPVEDLSRLHNQWMFRLIARNDYMAQAAAMYMTQDLHLTNLGALNTTDANSTDEVKEFIQEVPKISNNAAKVTVHQSLDPSATDLTPQLLALKSTQGWYSQGFPQTHALELKQRQQNGITAPVVLDYGGDVLLALKLVSNSQLTNVSYTSVCAPLVSSDPKAQSFVTNFKKGFGGYPPLSFFPPTAYDAMYLIQAAVNQEGGKATPAAIRDGLTKVTYTGVCGTYHSDANQNLIHSVEIVGLDNGQYSLKKTYDNLTGLSS